MTRVVVGSRTWSSNNVGGITLNWSRVTLLPLHKEVVTEKTDSYDKIETDVENTTVDSVNRVETREDLTVLRLSNESS